MQFGLGDDVLLHVTALTMPALDRLVVRLQRLSHFSDGSLAWQCCGGGSTVGRSQGRWQVVQTGQESARGTQQLAPPRVG